MKQLIIAAAISFTLLAAGCSSDADPTPQVTDSAVTDPTVTDPTDPVTPVTFDSGLLENGNFESGIDGWIGNAANATDDGSGSNTVNFANVAAAGNAFDVNLSQVVAIEQSKSYTLSFKAKSDRNRTILAGIGLNEAPFTNSSEVVNLTAEWQTHTLTLSAAAFGSENSRVLFDMGAEVGQVSIDDVSLVEAVNNTVFDDGLLTNGDFKDGTESWIGNAANAVDDGTGTNTLNFANVEAAGNAFDVNLSQVVAIDQGKTYTLSFKAKSDGERTILAGIGLNEAPFSNNSEAVSLTTELQTYTLTLAATDFGGANSRVLFDMGAETGQVFIDDVSLVEAVDNSVFDDGLLTNGNFEDDTDMSWIGNAFNRMDDGSGSNSVNYANVGAAGNAFDVNLSQVVAIDQGKNYTLSFRAKSGADRSIIAGIGLNEAPFSNTTETVNLTTEWQSYNLTLAATDFGNANSRVLFDMGAEVGEVFIDDVSLVEAAVAPATGSDSLTNGDFEDDTDSSWFGNAFNRMDDGSGSNHINYANVGAAGNAFDVNLSQVVTIEQGATYVLSFKARSDGNRTLLAGIGLNEAPFSNASETVNLTTEFQTYTLTLTATDFGNANSRVLFDMGAETGEVLIDDVTLMVQ